MDVLRSKDTHTHTLTSLLHSLTCLSFASEAIKLTNQHLSQTHTSDQQPTTELSQLLHYYSDHSGESPKIMPEDDLLTETECGEKKREYVRGLIRFDCHYNAKQLCL